MILHMAHREMLMLNVYSTDVVKNIFQSYVPGFYVLDFAMLSVYLRHTERG